MADTVQPVSYLLIAKAFLPKLPEERNEIGVRFFRCPFPRLDRPLAGYLQTFQAGLFSTGPMSGTSRTEFHSSGFRGSQSSLGSIADPAGFVLGNSGQDVDRQAVGVWVIAADEVDVRLHQR